ncbi:MAG TPA: P-II family nitrogen regulator [Myxococcota bacterium]|jgi:nitrogen regulatory protein PII|nr:P-II family nitrogen regulator [Myxococcota bacterium]
MKLVTAMIRPHRFEEVRRALAEIGVRGMTVTEVRGCGRQKGHTELYRGAEYVVELVPKTQLEVAVDDGDLETLIHTLTRAAATGAIGDGKIFVCPLEEVVRIRTGEEGPDAL